MTARPAAVLLLLWGLLAAQAAARSLRARADDPDGGPGGPANPSFGRNHVREFSPSRIIVTLRDNKGARGKARVIELKEGGRGNVEKALEEWRARKDVASAEPDYLVQADANPSDTKWNTQWNLKKVGAPAAWDTTVGSNITVCVADSGVDYLHPDLAGNMHPLLGYNAINNSTNPMDGLNHGTHLAGIIGAVGNNSAGIAGVNWKVKILACKFIDSSGFGYTSGALACINYCAANGANVISASFSSSVYTQSLADAITAAGQAGILFVASAGNNGQSLNTSPQYPAAFNLPNMLTVAATSSTDALSTYSNFSPTLVHLGAPGDWIMSTLPGGAYGYMSGTSMACPTVSGAAALAMAASGGRLTMAQIRQAILNSVDPLASLQGKVLTGGRLNVARLVAAASAA